MGQPVGRAHGDSPTGRLVWDVIDTVADWRSGALANDGLLVKLSDDDEAFDSSGPAFPSSTYADPALRPELAVSYVLDSS
jgi:hypothetical protein